MLKRNNKEKGLIARTPLSSKKFIAAMIWNLCWLFLIGLGIKNQLEPDTLNAMVYCSSFTQVGYLGGQSWIDVWRRKITGSNESKTPTDQ
jgi:hypothetical protein